MIDRMGNISMNELNIKQNNIDKPFDIKYSQYYGFSAFSEELADLLGDFNVVEGDDIRTHPNAKIFIKVEFTERFR